jgi:hypothetical protein
MKNLKNTIAVSLLLALSAPQASAQIVGSIISAVNKKNAVKEPYYTSGKNYTQDKGIVGELHKENVGKVVFSKKRIEPATATKAELTETFELGEQIVSRAYLPTCMANYKLISDVGNLYTNEEGSFYVKAKIDGGKEFLIARSAMNGELKPLTSINLYIYGAGENANQNWNDSFILEFNKLSEGTHEVTVEFYAGNDFGPTSKVPAAAGSFKVVKKKDSKVKLGKNSSTVKKGMNDPELEASILKALNNHAKKEGWKETFTKVVIKSEDWTMVRNKYTSVIISRLVEVIGFATWPNGECTGQLFDMAQEHNGSDFQKSLYVRGFGDRENYDCE